MCFFVKLGITSFLISLALSTSLYADSRYSSKNSKPHLIKKTPIPSHTSRSISTINNKAAPTQDQKKNATQSQNTPAVRLYKQSNAPVKNQALTAQIKRPLRIVSSTGSSVEHIPSATVQYQEKLVLESSSIETTNRPPKSIETYPPSPSKPPQNSARITTYEQNNVVTNQALKDLDSTSDAVRNQGWKRNIITTVFWVGQGRVIPTSATNYKSAWDGKWEGNYGGKDDPKNRAGFVPREFAATLNPFYVALPFNDVAYPELARKWIPWWQDGLGRWVSQCKGRWVEIRNQKGQSCFAQWEDVGPFVTNDAEYVFGTARPKARNGAGLDVSPAVRDYLGLTGRDLTDWRFVEAHQVPPGPWIKYGEQAIIFSALKKKEEKLDRTSTLAPSSTTPKNQPEVQANTKSIPTSLSEGL